MKDTIRSHIPTECPWGETMHIFDSIDSTNTRLKEMARAGAPEGTVLLAHSQTGGRGRLGRSFHSPKNKGIYFSLLLRPDLPAAKLMHLTCAVGVAVCNAVETVMEFRPGIKWINDLVAGKQKTGGILTELSIDPAGKVAYAVIGIGINCSHKREDFPAELQDIATSLEAFTGKTAFEMAESAFLRHVSQQPTGFEVAVEGSDYDCSAYTLVYSTVGDDIIGGDFFENIPRECLSIQ